MANFFYRDKPIIGLDISHTGMKIMSIDAKKWLVTGYGSIDLDPQKVQASMDERDPYLEKSLAQLVNNNIIGSMASNHVVLGVPSGKTFTRVFTVPPKTEKHIDDAVKLEVEQYIPIPEGSLYIDHAVIERSDEALTILICAVPRIVVDVCVAAAEKAGLRVSMIEPSASAVARLLENTEEGHLPTVIVDIGQTSTDIAVLDGSIRVTGSVSIGGNTFTLDIAKKLKVPLENAHQLKVLNGLNAGNKQQKIVSALSPNLDKILAETRKVMRYYDERLSNHKKLEQVLIVGGGANVPGIGEYFTNALVMPVRVASPWQKLNFGKLEQPTKHFRPRYITVAGLASVKPESIWS